MPDDYVQTAATMRDAAVSLRASGQDRNACYLAGYVIECVAKVMLQQAPNPGHIKHHDLEGLGEQFLAATLSAGFAIGRYGDPTRLAPTMIAQVGPTKIKNGQTVHYCHWDPFHRYDGSRWDANTVKQYLQEAEAAYSLLIQMQLDGVI